MYWLRGGVISGISYLRLALVAPAALLGALAAGPVYAVPSPRPAWDRDVGRRHSHRPGRAERKRLRWGGKIDVRINGSDVRQAMSRLGQQPGVKVSVIGKTAGDFPLYRVDIKGQRRGGQRPLKVLISAGVHGNEVGGVATAIKLAEKAVKDRGLRRRFDITVLPMINATGQRNNADGEDLNRCFINGKWTGETAAIRDALRGQRFDLHVDLHGARRHGFFLIRGNNDGTISRRVLSAMETGALLDATPGTRSSGPYALHALGAAMTTTPGTFKGYMSKRVPYSYTLEYDRTLPPARQLQGNLKLLRSALYNVEKHGSFGARPR